MKTSLAPAAFALMMVGCAAHHPPALPLKLAVEASDAGAGPPPPPTGAEILQAQPSQVRDAIKEHEQSGKWPIYRTPGSVLYPYDEGPQPESTARHCAPPTSSSNRARR